MRTFLHRQLQGSKRVELAPGRGIFFAAVVETRYIFSLFGSLLKINFEQNTVTRITPTGTFVISAVFRNLTLLGRRCQFVERQV
jgi:hypothetical protein